LDACKKPKPEPEEEQTGNGKNITITLPADQTILILDLGDSLKAMQGVVIKNDKGKQITEGIVIEGLDEVGRKGLTYIVKESDGKVVQKSRQAIVKADKLCGSYKATVISRPTWDPVSYDVLKNDTNIVAVTIANIWMGGVSYDFAVFTPDESTPYALKFIDGFKTTQGSMYGKARFDYGKTGDIFAFKTGFLEGYRKDNDLLVIIDTVLLEKQ
jgi:hypothetical protein